MNVVAEPGLETPVAAATGGAASGGLDDVDGRAVARFTLGGGPHRGALGEVEAGVVETAVRLGVESGLPIVGRLATSGADVHQGVAALHAWGRVARVLHEASGSVPVVLGVEGPCVSGPALLLGIADQVVMTEEAFAYVSGPGAVGAITGVETDHDRLGGSAVHAVHTGLATLVVPDSDGLEDALASLLSYLPSNSFEHAPAAAASGWGDPVERRCERAGRVVPERSNASYDVRAVVDDVLDGDSFLELRERWAPNLVTGLGRLGGTPVGVLANQPCQRAGTIDIAAAQKGARFVQWCDAFNVPLVTFVDTPGFEPGKTLEWRGMIRHGAQLVHAYAEASVPRLCVVLRKAYGGAYIVMDSKGLGNDLCVAWPRAEIAVMGGRGAVQVLHRRRLSELEGEERRAFEAEAEEEYAREFLNPWRAARRGLVDAVVAPESTRAVLARALRRLGHKRERPVQRRHSNIPL